MIQSEKIQSINDPGWEGLDAVADNSKLGMEQRELNVAFIDQPAWNPGSDHSVGYSREGQNSIIREIMYRIERAKNG